MANYFTIFMVYRKQPFSEHLGCIFAFKHHLSKATGSWTRVFFFVTLCTSTSTVFTHGFWSHELVNTFGTNGVSHNKIGSVSALSTPSRLHRWHFKQCLHGRLGRQSGQLGFSSGKYPSLHSSISDILHSKSAKINLGINSSLAGVALR